MADSRSRGEAGGLSRRKKLVFSAVVVALWFALAELALALVGVDPVLYDEDPYVGFASRIPLYVEDPEAAGWRITAPNKHSWFNPQRFPDPKPEGTRRIFCVGGSTTYGRPYDDTTSFCGWLREMLAVSETGATHWEVVNAGGISYASYRVAALMEELIDYEPDLFVVYSGHNESLERRTYRDLIETPQLITETNAWLSHTRIFSVAQEVGAQLTESVAGGGGGSTVLPAEVETLLDGSVGPQDYTRDDDQRLREEAHYRFNLDRMIEIARTAGSRILLVTPASNLTDSAPFKSEISSELSPFKRDLFRQLVTRADEAERDGRPAAALGALEEAATIDPRHALTQYRRGRLLLAQGRVDRAREALRRARDEDVCPLRARSRMREIVREVAAEREVELVDFAALIDRASEGLPGAGQFLDHVHFTIDVHGMLARALLGALARMDLVEGPGTLAPEQWAQVQQTIESRVDDHAHGVALRNLAKVLSWAGKLEDSERAARRAMERLGPDAESHYLIGASAQHRGRLDRAVRHYQAALELDPGLAEAHNNLGSVLRSRGDAEGALLHFRAFVAERPALAAGHYNLGVALDAVGRRDEARASYRAALARDPSFERARARLVGVSAGPPRGDVDAELASRSTEVLFRTGNSLLSQRRYGEAVRYYEAALHQRPDLAAVHGNLAVALRSLGRETESLDHFRAVVELLPEDAAGHFNLGTALAEEGELLAAARAFEQAARVRPGWPKPAESLADLVVTARAQPARYDGPVLADLEARAQRLSATAAP